MKDEILEINNDGTIEINKDYFNFLDEKKIYNNRFNSLFDGIERSPSQEICRTIIVIYFLIQKLLKK